MKLMMNLNQEGEYFICSSTKKKRRRAKTESSREENGVEQDIDDRLECVV
jgi:hypothetical protein